MAAILDEYERLTAEKRKLEDEISAIAEELTSGANPAGLRGALVDAEGYPRGDIDVYRVRHQRHAFATKQYDHKVVMQRIEQILPQVFEAKMANAKAKESGDEVKPPTPPDAKPVAPTTKSEAPAAFVPKEIDSPAEWADLHAADQVVVFGTADAANHRNLEAVKEIVMHNIGSPIRVVVRRVPLERPEEQQAQGSTTPSEAEWEFHELLLTPQQWSGAGVLGCLLMPVQETSP